MCAVLCDATLLWRVFKTFNAVFFVAQTSVWECTRLLCHPVFTPLLVAIPSGPSGPYKGLISPSLLLLKRLLGGIRQFF